MRIEHIALPWIIQLLQNAAGDAATTSHDNMLTRIGLPSIPPSIQFNMDAIGLMRVLSTSDALAFLPAKISRLMFDHSDVSEIPLGDPDGLSQAGVLVSKM